MSTVNILDIQLLWVEVSENIKKHISSNSFNAWLSSVYPLKFEDEGKIIVLGVPNELTRSWIQKNYQKIIASEIIKINPSVRNVKLTISRRATKKPIKPAAQTKNVPLDFSVFDRETNLNPDFVFDNFVVAPYNRFAHTAARAVIEKFGTLYNPFYVYGPTGVGKTHLLQAIGNKIKQIEPKTNVYYTTGEAFMEKFITAIKKDRVQDFRNAYQKNQLFIIDDVHFLEKSDSSLVEMFHLFNALVNKNAQIILSSDKPPQQLKKTEDRIRTRLSSGIVIDIQTPQRDDMEIVCKERLEEMSLDLDDEAVEYVVDNVSNNIRELNGALKTINVCLFESEEKNVDLQAVKKYIRNNIKPKPNISCDSVIDEVCRHYNIDQGQISTKSRRREIVRTRQMIMYIFRETLGLSYSLIGKQFGNRDHTTVMHACEKIGTELKENSATQKEFENIMKGISV